MQKNTSCFHTQQCVWTDSLYLCVIYHFFRMFFTFIEVKSL